MSARAVMYSLDGATEFHEVRWRPMLFSGPMVRALLDGRKTQTRRVMKINPAYIGRWKNEPARAWASECPYGQPGERLWVREAWQADTGSCNPAFPDGPLWWHEVPRSLRTSRAFRYLYYGADNAIVSWDENLADLPWEDRRSAWVPTDKDPDFFARELRWRPSIHMPRWASRITLEITDVRVERVQEISCADAIAEGIPPAANSQTIDCDTANPRDEFRALWDSINDARGYGWDANPWVWALTFRRVA